MSESSSIDLVEMKAEDGARLNLCLAYSISSLYFGIFGNYFLKCT